LGKLTGWSGIFNGLIKYDKEAFPSKINLICGAVTAGTAAWLAIGSSPIVGVTLFDEPETYIAGIDLFGWILAGILVGMGTKIGSGCTSGHGVCGIPRLSIRSLVAVGTFMATGVLAATFRYNYPFLNNTVEISTNASNANMLSWVGLGIALMCSIVSLLVEKRGSPAKTDLSISFIVGLLFGVGLLISGMGRRSKIIGFLTLNSNWDPSLMFVMVGAVMTNFVTFHYILQHSTPMYGTKFDIPQNKVVDSKLVAGAALFGLGWGIGGLCPGPALLGWFIYLPPLMVFLLSLAVGQFVGDKIIPFWPKVKVV